MPRDEDFEQFLESFQRTGFTVMKPNFAPLSIKKLVFEAHLKWIKKGLTRLL